MILHCETIQDADAEDIRENIKCFDRIAEYVQSYETYELNNHFSWKWACLMAYSIVVGDAVLYSKACDMFRVCMTEQFSNTGYQPLEMCRGDKGRHYATMNLEALAFMAWMSDLYKEALYCLAESHRYFMSDDPQYTWVSDWIDFKLAHRGGIKWEGRPEGSHLLGA